MLGFLLSDFDIINSVWKVFLDSIVAEVSACLGVDATRDGVSAELYKKLLYDEGPIFKQHQDSEKAESMFATLAIVLPSKHEGGEVKLIHTGKTKILDASKFSQTDLSYLAWFSVINQETKLVLSGGAAWFLHIISCKLIPHPKNWQ